MDCNRLLLFSVTLVLYLFTYLFAYFSEVVVLYHGLRFLLSGTIFLFLLVCLHMIVGTVRTGKACDVENMQSASSAPIKGII